MFTFTSVHNRYRIFGAPIDGVPEYDVAFEPIGSMGRFSTQDEELAEKLRAHPSFGKKFMEIGLQAKENPTIVQGIRGSSDKPELGKESLDPQKLIQLGVYQATLLKKDGTYRKDAPEEEKIKYEQLKKELGA
jgi:hypothetical protein